jgi:putative FmdB family regulatory protein
MPLYEYRCGTCARVFEAYTRLADDGKKAVCPVCGGASEKVGISMFHTGGPAEGPAPGGSSCGGGSRRSPFG